MKITVTQKHIDKGVKRSTKSCALSLAFKNAGFPEAFVGILSVWPFGANKENEGRRWVLPLNAVNFRQDFDSGECVRPFTFEMDIPTC